MVQKQMDKRDQEFDGTDDHISLGILAFIRVFTEEVGLIRFMDWAEKKLERLFDGKKQT